MSLFNREREIGTECFINPQSAIRNPYSPLPFCLFSFHLCAKEHV